MPTVTNGDLYNWPTNVPRTDHLYVVTVPPNTRRKITTVQINFAVAAAVVDKCQNLYTQPYTVSEIQRGTGQHWLLSGGCLVTNQDKLVAVGVRDGNAADPFAITNLAAGRCDQRLEEHCKEEMASEFILCVQPRANNPARRRPWRQVKFSQATTPLCSLNKAAVWTRTDPIVQDIFKSGGMSRKPPMTEATLRSPLKGTIVVEWRDGNRVIQCEKLKGYLWRDNRNKTIEFRRGVKINLSAYADSRIFFGEGTGYAEWIAVRDIRRLAKFRRFGGRNVITPFLSGL